MKNNYTEVGFMADNKTYYAGTAPFSAYPVTFIVNETQELLTKPFDSHYLAWKFVNKMKRSKKCTLVSYPVFK